MTHRTLDTQADTPRPDRRTRGEWLRYVPPVAALGTAFVLQVILITDTVGQALADRQPDTKTWPWYALAGLLGVSVASCVEGGAAYLMDLYDRHLLAGDSVWVLRLAMLAYVAGSAAAVHWWTGHRGLPEVVSWVLAGMSASALFLWSRGSRWAQRDAMRAAGQLDRAMPRMSVAAKAFHPWRYLVTLWLISWEPVDTVADARARHAQWKADRKARKVAKSRRRSKVDTPPVGQPVEPDTTPDSRPKVVPMRRPGTRPARSGQRADSGRAPTVSELADTLTLKHGREYVGLPTALSTLKSEYGSCAKERAIEAKNIHNARREQAIRTGQADLSDDDKERPTVGAAVGA